MPQLEFSCKLSRQSTIFKLEDRSCSLKYNRETTEFTGIVGRIVGMIVARYKKLYGEARQAVRSSGKTKVFRNAYTDEPKVAQ